MLADCTDVLAGREARHEHDGEMGSERHLADRQPVHVIQRCRHQQPVSGVRAPGDPLLDNPQVAAMGERHSLGPSGRAGGVEKQRHLVPVGTQGLERARVRDALETLRAAGAEHQRRQSVGNRAAPVPVDQGEPAVGVVEDEGDGLRREPVVDGHRHQPRPHHRTARDKELGAVGGEDRHPVAAGEPQAGQPAGGCPAGGVELAVAPGARAAGCAAVDERGVRGIGGPVEQVAEVRELGHRGRVSGRVACGGGTIAKLCPSATSLETVPGFG